MWNDHVFEILEIEPTYDTKKIKKAYANLVKKYHPEEFPEKWKEIRAAYKTALGLAGKDECLDGRVKMPEPVIDDRQQPVIEDRPQSSKENQPEPVVKSGRTESLLKPPEESGEMDSLFDNIGELSKEQQQQNEKAFQRELRQVMDAFRKISDKKRLDIKEWEDFFYQDTRLPYICTREFLEMLGDCFLNRKIDAEMYRFLKGQLAVIAKYIRDRDIVLKEIGILKPVDYAEKNIYRAYAGKSAAAGRSGSGTTNRKTRKAVWVILIIVSIIVRSSIRHARNAREMSELQTIPRTVIENTIANSTIENVGNDTVEHTIADSTAENTDDEIAQNIIANNIAEKDGNVVRTHIPFIPDKIKIGDAREAMIEALGEPDEIQELQEDPDYEEAVYSVLETRLVVVLENDVITDIYGEYTMENAASDTHPVMDLK